MGPKTRTQDVNRSFYANYLQKSRECFEAAQESFVKENWNACAINAIHSSISACDALCVYALGKRHSGENHNEAIKLLKTVRSNEIYNINANRLNRILNMKNMAEYEERLVYQKEAEKILKDCERFLEFVNTQVSG